MTIEQSHGKARPTLPRASDLPATIPAADRPVQRDAQGRFIAGNGIGNGRHWKRTIARQLGSDLEGEAGQLGRDAWVLFRAFMAELPVDCASVRQLVAARARAAVLSARYARRAAELGLDTAEGMKAMERATVLDQRAERLAVTSLDIAVKLAGKDGKRKVLDAHAAVLDVFGGGKP